MPSESALVVLVPEAESLVEPFRRQYDPSAANGVPAHVTILYPFKSPSQLTSEITKKLRELFLKIPGFTVSFMVSRRFPDFLYLAPEPSQPFRHLTEIVAKLFPETPPYGGEFKDIIPHLTVAQAEDAKQMEQIASDFQKFARGKLPIKAAVNTVSLMDNEKDRWQVREHFLLHQSAPGS